MKRILTILFLFISITAFSQKYSYEWIRSQDITNTRHFIWQGDTIDFSTFGAGINDVAFEDNYLKFYNGTEIIDSVYFEYASSIDSFSVVGDSIKLKLSDTESEYLNINFIREKLDSVFTNSTITGNGTELNPLGIDTTILANSMKTVYELTLPAASTIDGRISGAVEGVDYPSGWVLDSGNDPADLEITHSVEKRAANVNVFYNVSGTEFRQLVNFNNAYTGILTPSLSTLRIEGLATIQKEIKIYIMFTQ